MGRGIGHAAGIGTAFVAIVGALAVLGGGRTGVAQEVPGATVTREAEAAELTALRTQVAALSTEVALLGGADESAVGGRLGGRRAGFEAAYGAPTAYVGDDQAVYAVAGVGRVTVTFEEDRAVRLIVSPDRPVEIPSDEPDPADFDLTRAEQVAADFAPSDAELAEFDPEAADGVVASGTSDALLGGADAPDTGSCETAGSGAFTVSLMMPSEETVSAVVLERAADAATAAPTPAPAVERETSGGRAVVRVGLGGSASVQGIRVEGVQIRRDGEVGESGATLAIELAIANDADGDLLLDPSHFVLVDNREREVPAVCGGVEPFLNGEEIASGESIRGWVTFVLPDRFSPSQVTYFVNGSGSTQVVFALD